MCLTCSWCKRSSLVVITFVRTWRAESRIQSSPLPEDHAHLVDLTIIHERNSRQAVRQRLAVQLGFSDSTIDAVGVLDRDLVARGVILVDDLESGPLPGYAGRKEQELSLQAKTEDRFDADPVQAPGRAGVPGPSAAPDVRSDRIDIGGDGVGLDLVALHVGSCARAADRIHEREHLGGLVSLAEGGKGNHRPRGGMVVLAAVFPNAGRIALDISGIERRPIDPGY